MAGEERRMVAGGVEPPSEVAYNIAFFVRLKFPVPSFVPSNFRAVTCPTILD